MISTRLALLGLLAAASAGCETAAQPDAAAPAVLEHVQVHEAPGLTKQQLCTAARDWAAITFKDSKAVVEVFDAEQGKMIGKGRSTVPFMGTSQPIDFTVIVECRDGRARATFADPLMTSMNSGQRFPASTSPSAVFRANVLAELGRIDGLLAAYLKNPRLGGQW
jgi:hypothetical protein